MSDSTIDKEEKGLIEALRDPSLATRAADRAAMKEAADLLELYEAERSSWQEATGVLFKALGWKEGGLGAAAIEIVKQRDQALLLPSASGETIKYVRWPDLDKRFNYGDDFAGDAWVRWVAPGQKPEDAA